ncbi:surface lipoprotein assembly modifier [Avibacterium avium]|uniref:surface lipoprotein assembly modifier n=1 Tax=Avibacterium avium TaxID=751 RepID=UPI0039FCB620
MRFSTPSLTLALLLLSPLLLANPERSQPLPISNIAQPEPLPQAVQNPPVENINWQSTALSASNIQNQLNLALRSRNAQKIAYWLNHYHAETPQQQFLRDYAQGVLAQLQGDYPQAVQYYRQLLAQSPQLNPIRLELARSLFALKQDDNARNQFEKLLSAPDLPAPLQREIQAYLNALQQRNQWEFQFSGYYVRDTNVNNANNTREIEAIPQFYKKAEWLPQTAHGVAYGMQARRDFNIGQAYYLHLNAELFGKTYWDNHDYDDLYTRAYLGLKHKSPQQTWAILPFYERRFYGNHRYQKGAGLRLEYQRWLTPHWQISSALEYTKTHYDEIKALNGDNRLWSSTLLWLSSPQQFFTLGIDYQQERTQVKRYQNHTQTLRLGWGREWQWGISSRIQFSIAKRDYQDVAKVAIFSLGKPRQDRIYRASFLLWKRDWHWLGITPKLQFQWRKQHSNLPSLYNYQNRSINVIFEKSF